MARPLNEIAVDIARDWVDPRSARPYLQAMKFLRTLDDQYGMDDAESIVMYFLTNAGSWKGPVATSIKKELRSMLKTRGYRAASIRVATRWANANGGAL